MKNLIKLHPYEQSHLGKIYINDMSFVDYNKYNIKAISLVFITIPQLSEETTQQNHAQSHSVSNFG